VNLATIKSLAGVAVVILGMLNVPAMTPEVRSAVVVAGGWVVGLFVHKTATPAVVASPHWQSQGAPPA
jgi:hypothetical protein